MEPPAEGETETFERTFTVEDVRRFADLSGDAQPRHLEPDDDGRVMVQGLLTATLPTKIGGDNEVLGRRFEFEFLEPVYTDDPITCTATYESIEERADRYVLSWDIVCENDSGATVLRGTVDGIVWKDG